MRIEQQGQDECMLTAIAALAERPLAEIRERACDLAGVSYWTQVVTRNDDSYWVAVETLIKELNLTGIPTFRKWDAAYRTTRMAAPSANLNLAGRGSICFTSSGDAAHICAYEDGLVYDSSRPERGYTVEEFCTTFNCMVRGIFPAKQRKTRPQTEKQRIATRDRIRAWRADKKRRAASNE